MLYSILSKKIFLVLILFKINNKIGLFICNFINKKNKKKQHTRD